MPCCVLLNSMSVHAKVEKPILSRLTLSFLVYCYVALMIKHSHSSHSILSCRVNLRVFKVLHILNTAKKYSYSLTAVYKTSCASWCKNRQKILRVIAHALLLQSLLVFYANFGCHIPATGIHFHESIDKSTFHTGLRASIMRNYEKIIRYNLLRSGSFISNTVFCRGVSP